MVLCGKLRIALRKRLIMLKALMVRLLLVIFMVVYNRVMTILIFVLRRKIRRVI